MQRPTADDREHGVDPAAADHPLLRPPQRAAQAAQGRRQSMQQTISELITATEIAERAIAGLKATVREGDETLGERLQGAERFTRRNRSQNITAGAEVLDRLVANRRRASDRRRAGAEEPRRRRDAKSIVAAAQAFAERTRARVERAWRHERLAARFPADADRADGDRLPVRAQDHRLVVRRRLYARPAAGRQRHAGGDDRAGGAGGADAFARGAARDAPPRRRSKRSWMQEMFNYPRRHHRLDHHDQARREGGDGKGRGGQGSRRARSRRPSPGRRARLRMAP